MHIFKSEVEFTRLQNLLGYNTDMNQESYTLELEIHPLQAEILVYLLFNVNARFSELNSTGVTSDHFSFHVKRLLDIGLLHKNSDGTYELTRKGKEFANRFDTDVSRIEKQAKTAVLVIPVDNGNNMVLMQQRLKQPFYGNVGFVTGKIRWGESVLEAAERELLEETYLTATLTVCGVVHKRNYSRQHELLEDKYFYVVRAEDVQGDIQEDFEGGKNYWISISEVSTIEKRFDDVIDFLAVIQTDDVKFSELRDTVTAY